ncbi:hypothetical protein SH601_05110 [Gracilibacillus sp. S3-1-1]|uniref:Uncharacterized protein n=1 Tax=Gracilibacillus pellucidus TaxID=3095368 RepID=A0ACC6M377_9BACI|nr:hypothetical protein [Gracilibacillus sp. S3-1-1]MDX8045363.1 hypothetical protein [Gracilibacillus sp. S3-1-1]
MFAISKREFFESFKGVKSIIIIAIFLMTAYFSTKFSDWLLFMNIDFTSQETELIHTFAISVLILVFGMLFTMGLSHDVMNREIHERTVRFLVTRTSRVSIIMGKFLGVVLFWFTCLLTSFLIISIFAHQFDVITFLQSLSLLVYYCACTLLLSVLISKPGFSMFLSMIIGIAFPIFNGWVFFTTNAWISWLKYLLPFYYVNDQDYRFMVIFLLAGVLLFIALKVFKRREC